MTEARDYLDFMFAQGEVDGCTLTVNPRTGEARVAAGTIYLGGEVLAVGAATIAVPLSGAATVGVFRVAGQLCWGEAGDRLPGEFVPVWELAGGEPKPKAAAPLMGKSSGFQLRYTPQRVGSLKDRQHKRPHRMDVAAAADKLRNRLPPDLQQAIDHAARITGNDDTDRWALGDALRRLDVLAFADKLKKRAPKQWRKAIDQLARIDDDTSPQAIEAALIRLATFAGQHGDALRHCVGDEELRQRARAMAQETSDALTSIFVNHGVTGGADRTALQDRLDRHEAFSAATAGKTAAQVRRESGRDLALWAQADALSPQAHAETMDMLKRLKAAAADAVAFLVQWCDSNQVEPPKLRCGAEAEQVHAAINRARDAAWWVRALRKAAARIVEAGAIKLGVVHWRTGGYCSDDTLWRRKQQQRRNANMLASQLMRNEAGQVFSLAELAAASVSNPVNRGGELMTRIRGCEEYADAAGHVGLFLTLTTPSAMHPMLSKVWRKKSDPSDTASAYKAIRNPRYDGVSTPRDAQKWLTGQWAKVRATLARKDLPIYGFRVCEPHHDGTPHWHALIWCRNEEEAKAVQAIVYRFWVETDKRYAGEKGAAKNRTNFKALKKGGAAGYIAKYISKSIGHHNLAEHIDQGEDGDLVTVELGGEPGHLRVDAWASTWGIRQFQAIGQPSVTVWREVRRVSEDQVRALYAKEDKAATSAWHAAQKVGERAASWCDYLKALGGVCLARLDYKLQPACRTTRKSNKYGERLQMRKVVGVITETGKWLVSRRQGWMPLEDGQEAVQAKRRIKRGETPQDEALRAACGAPWTGFNNCNARLTEGRANWLYADIEARAKATARVEEGALVAQYLAARWGEQLSLFGATPEEAQAPVVRMASMAREVQQQALLGASPEREQLNGMSAQDLQAMGWTRAQAAVAIDQDHDERLQKTADYVEAQVADLLKRLAMTRAQAVADMEQDGWLLPRREYSAPAPLQAPAITDTNEHADLDAAMAAMADALGYA